MDLVVSMEVNIWLRCIFGSDVKMCWLEGKHTAKTISYNIEVKLSKYQKEREGGS